MATRTWKGGALAVAQVNTITMSGTWLQNDTITVTINSRDLVLTVGTLVTNAQVATSLKQAIENETLTDTSASVTPVDGKVDFPELAEMTATVSAAVVTLTADEKGVPITITASDSSTGGTATLATSTTATGPNFADNADNWSGATIPTASDTIVFQDNDVDMLYQLDDTIGNTSPNILIYSSYTGRIGLPSKNPNGYDEYRETFWKVGDTSPTITVGIGEGPGSKRLFISRADTGTLTATVYRTGQREVNETPPLVFGGVMGNTDILGGDVGIGLDEQNAHTSTGNLVIASRDASVIMGGNSYYGGTVLMFDGSLVNYSRELTADAAIQQHGGVIRWKTQDIDTIEMTGGTLYLEEGAVFNGSSVVVSGGTLDASRSLDNITISTIDVYGTGAINDPFKRLGSVVVDFNYGSDPSRSNLGYDYRVTRGSTA